MAQGLSTIKYHNSWHNLGFSHWAGLSASLQRPKPKPPPPFSMAMPARQNATRPRAEPSALPPPLPGLGVQHEALAALATGPIEYRARTSLIDSALLYRLDSQTLEIHRVAPALGSAPREPERIPLADITRIRIRYFPTRVQRNRFECQILSRLRGSLTLTNEEYLGLYNFADRSQEYRRFVQALCAAVALRNARAHFAGGGNALVLFLEWSFCGGAFLALALVLWTLGGPLRGLVILKLAIIAFYLPTLARYAARSMPSHFNPLNVPERYLPPLKQNTKS